MPVVPGAKAQAFMRAAKAPNTLRAYQADLRDFDGWCAENDRAVLPATPATICDYVTALANGGAKASTIRRRLSAISQAHQAAGFVPSPTQDWSVRTTLQGIRRQLGVAPEQKAPLTADELARLIGLLPNDLSGLRDRPLLLIGFFGAFRRSELVALSVADVQVVTEGLRITVRRSKTDQEGAGLVKGIPRRERFATDPVRTLRAWLDAARIVEGPLWRPVNRHGQLQPGRLSASAIADVVKRSCVRAGLDPDLYAGHSLRAGLATSAAWGGAPDRAIKKQGGWTSHEYERYIRDASVFRDNAGDYVTGL